jgi:hypothetical protein
MVIQATRDEQPNEGAMWHDSWKPEEAATAKQQCGKHVSTAMNQQATIKELTEAVFSVRVAPWLYSEDQQGEVRSQGLE